MHILVTGANGFVGQHLITHLLAQGDKVTASWRQRKPILPEAVALEQLDLLEAEQVHALIERENFDAIIHLAAVSFVPDAEKDFLYTINMNVVTAKHLISACIKKPTPTKIICISSSEAYGNFSQGELPLDEKVPLRPTNSYGLSKSILEAYAGMVERLHPGLCVIMRSFNHIGPGQRSDFAISSFAKQLAEIKLGLREAVIRVGDLNPVRDYSDVRDIVRAYRLALVKPSSGVYPLCSGMPYRIGDMLDILIENSGCQVRLEVEAERTRKNEVSRVVGSYARAERELNWKPSIKIEQSLADVFNYWLGVLSHPK